MSDQTALVRQPIPHLLEEPTISVYPSLAVIFGVNTAIVLQQLHFLLNVTKRAKSKYNFVEGQWWVYNTYKEWQDEYFPWLSPRTIQRCFLELENVGVVKSRQSVKHKSDRTKWYSIDYQKCAEYLAAHPHSDKMASSNHDDKTAQSNVQKMHDGYTETTTEMSENLSAPNGTNKPSPTKSDRIPAEKMNPMKDAIALAFGYDWNTMTKGEIGIVQSAAKELCQVNAAPEQVAVVYQYCKRNYTHFSPKALATKYSEAMKQHQERKATDGFIPPEQRTSPLDNIHWMDGCEPAWAKDNETA